MEEENETFQHACCDCDSEFISLPALLTHYDSVHISAYGTGPESNQPLLCPYCLRHFTEDSNFAAHIALHENDVPLFSCEICTKCFQSEKHMRFHQGESLYKCTFCQILLLKSDLEKHLGKHRRSQLYECSTCSALISYKEITIHMKLHNYEGGIVSTCDKCAKAFPSRKNYSLHMKRGHDTYPCDICLAVVFNTREEWENHRQIHFAGSFPCFVCNKVFTEAAGLKNHQDICCHHTNGLSKSQIQATVAVVTENCPFCLTILTSRNEMKAHIRSDHIDLLAYQCQQCDEICFGRQEFLIHKQYSHSTRFKCGLCSLDFSTPEELETHSGTHQQMKTVFACEFCGMVYKTKENLFNHKLTHSQSQSMYPQVQVQPLKTLTRTRLSTNISASHNSGQKHYHQVQPITSIREKMFNPVTTLSKITSGNVNILFRCKSCNLLFRGEDNFQEHKRKVHQAKTNYSFNCKPCSSSFKTMPELKQHQSTCVYKNSIIYKPYLCSKCDKKFMLEGSLNLHDCTKLVNTKKSSDKRRLLPTSEENTDVTFVLTIA